MKVVFNLSIHFFVGWVMIVCGGCSFVQAETVVIGHRGGQASETPENTLVCIQDSFSREIWGHEIDVRTTSDGKLMILHDGTIDRTTNGTGSFGDFSAAEIKLLDAGSWKGSQFTGEKVPYLTEALELIKGNGTRAYLDIKVANAAALQLAVNEAEFDESKLTFLTFHNGQSTEFITEFPLSEVFQSLYGTTYDSETIDPRLAGFSAIGVKGVTIYSGRYSKAYVNAIHAAGLKVAIVGPNVSSPQLLEEYIELGVDELWLDDVEKNFAVYKSSDGELSIPPLQEFVLNELVVDEGEGAVHLSWSSQPGRNYRLESSSNLLDWETEQTGVMGSVFELQTTWSISQAVPQPAAMFYRAVKIDE